MTASRARDLVAGGMVRPDLILADYNLPNGMNGTDVAKLVREELDRPVPTIILTGDISTGTSGKVALQDCVQLNKPVKLKELAQAIQRLLPLSRAAVQARAPRPIEVPGNSRPPVIFVVDDDDSIRGAIRAVLEDDNREVEDYETLRGVPGGVSSRAGGLPGDRRVSTRHEWPDTAAAAA